MSRFDEAGTAAFDLEMFDKGLDPVLRQLEDSRQQIIDAQRANLDELRKFATADTMNAASASGMVFDVPEDQEFLYERLMKERKELQQELFDFNRKNEEAIAARRAQLQDAVLREEMEEQQRIAAQEQADIEAAAALQAKEDAEFDKRMQERNANRMRATRSNKRCSRRRRRKRSNASRSSRRSHSLRSASTRQPSTDSRRNATRSRKRAPNDWQPGRDSARPKGSRPRSAPSRSGEPSLPATPSNR